MNTMKLVTTTRTLARRTFRTVFAVAVMAVLLAGLASPAGATQKDPDRQAGVDAANDYIDRCFANNGDPVVIMDSTGKSLTVACRWSSGNTSVCSFLPARPCQSLPGGIRADLSKLPVVSSGQATPVVVRPGTHLALSGSQLVFAAHER